MLELQHVAVPFPAVQFEDSSQALHKTEKGGILDLHTLRDVSVLIHVAGAVRRCLVVNQQTAAALFAYYGSLPDLSELRDEIDACVSAEGEMLDHASPALYEALRLAQGLKQRIRRRVENMVASSRFRDLLQEPYYAERENRYVLPIKAERQHDLHGIVHDISASGATVFMEPRELIDLNNQIKVAELQVTREINRILQELTSRVVQHLDDLRSLLQVLTTLDCIGAKARLSARMNGTPVRLNTDGHVRLWNARHPLLPLPKEQVVPNDVMFEKDFAVLVISGPNTGGKTVLLKLLGLCSLMVRGGLHLPCRDGSEMAFFEETFADIGDAQDLTKDLSSFSAHISKLIGLLKSIEHRTGGESPQTLVLLDEVISSTDPAEGAALAEALLRRFAELNLKVVVTTHYNSLKTLALSTPGFLNASLEFDVNTLAPTYRFISGIPGGSSALDIAGRLGMDPSILDQALDLGPSGRPATRSRLHGPATHPSGVEGRTGRSPNPTRDGRPGRNRGPGDCGTIALHRTRRNKKDEKKVSGGVSDSPGGDSPDHRVVATATDVEPCAGGAAAVATSGSGYQSTHGVGNRAG